MKRIDYLNLMITYHSLLNDKQAVEHFRRKLSDALNIMKIKNIEKKMKISELIKHLNDVMKEEGDIEVLRDIEGNTLFDFAYNGRYILTGKHKNANNYVEGDSIEYCESIGAEIIDIKKRLIL